MPAFKPNMGVRKRNASSEMPVGVVNGSSDGPTLTVTGGLFATEFSGVEAASRMYRDFDPDDRLSGTRCHDTNSFGLHGEREVIG